MGIHEDMPLGANARTGLWEEGPKTWVGREDYGERAPSQANPALEGPRTELFFSFFSFVIRTTRF